MLFVGEDVVRFVLRHDHVSDLVQMVQHVVQLEVALTDQLRLLVVVFSKKILCSLLSTYRSGS